MTIYINHADQDDIPAVLRQLADDIDSGVLDGIRECAFVMDDGYSIFVGYCGTGEAAPSAHLLLCKGAAQIAGAR
jgi:hypothetical protein